MHWEDKKNFTWLASLWYLLYCSGLEVNPWHLCSMSIFPEPLYVQSPPLSTSLTRTAQLLQRIRLHWDVIIPQSPKFTSGFTQGSHSVDLDRCIIMRGWDGWVASPTGWTWVWASFGDWWWTGKPGELQSMESQRAGHDWATELTDDCKVIQSIFTALKIMRAPLVHPSLHTPDNHWSCLHTSAFLTE